MRARRRNNISGETYISQRRHLKEEADRKQAWFSSKSTTTSTGGRKQQAATRDKSSGSGKTLAPATAKPHACAKPDCYSHQLWSINTTLWPEETIVVTSHGLQTPLWPDETM